MKIIYCYIFSSGEIDKTIFFQVSRTKRDKPLLLRERVTVRVFCPELEGHIADKIIFFK